jgi:hypothetical protein
MIRSLLHIALTTVLAAVLAVMTIVLIVGLAIAGPLWYVQRRRLRELRPEIALEGLNQRYALGDIGRTALWSKTDLAEMIDATLPKPGPRGHYKKAA